jgi:hypothetical protein
MTQIYTIDLIKMICSRDNCIVDFDTIIKFSDRAKCKFICSCGNIGEKGMVCMYLHGGGFCNECTKQNRKEKVIKTSLERYGVVNPSQLQDVKDKVKSTNLERLVENPNYLQEIQDKMKQTNLERYGVENVYQSEEIKDKIKLTMLEKYGVEFVSQSQ